MTSSSESPLPTQHTTTQQTNIHVFKGFAPAIPGTKPLQIYTSDRAASRLEVAIYILPLHLC